MHSQAQLPGRTVTPAQTASTPYSVLTCKGDHPSVMALNCLLQMALPVHQLASACDYNVKFATSPLSPGHLQPNIKLTDQQADKSHAAVEHEAARYDYRIEYRIKGNALSAGTLLCPMERKRDGCSDRNAHALTFLQCQTQVRMQLNKSEVVKSINHS